MAKRKRGGFSFLDTTRPKLPFVEKKSPLQNGILIVNTIGANLLLKQRDVILSIVKRHIDCKFLSGTKYEIHDPVESLFILLNIEINTSNIIKEIKRHFNYAKGFIIVENKHMRISNKDIIPITVDKGENSHHNQINDEQISLEPENSNPQLRIELTLQDVKGLLGFLTNRPINHQTRERYTEMLPDKTVPVSSKSNSSNRSTFVAKNVSFDKENVEVYVNGKQSTDVCCYVEEKTDAYILHLYYRGARQHSKTILISKEESKEPLQRIRYNDKDNTICVNGKNLTLTFEGYDAYRRNVKRDRPTGIKDDGPSIKYIGNPKNEHKTAFVRQTVVKKEIDSIVISFTEETRDNYHSSSDAKATPQQIQDSNDTNLKTEEGTPHKEERPKETGLLDSMKGITDKNAINDEMGFKKSDLNAPSETNEPHSQREKVVDKIKKNRKNESYLIKIWHWIIGSLLAAFIIRLLSSNKKDML